jgi:hypothetical protein
MRDTVVHLFVIDLIWGMVQIIKFVILQFSSISYYFLCLLGQDILLISLFSNIFNQFQAQTEQTVSEITALYILIFAILDSVREDRRF